MSKRFGRRERGLTAAQGDFIYLETEMLLSPAWQALTLNGRRVIERIYIEIRRHGGKDNGALPVTYANFAEHGVKSDYTLRAIAEVVALGFVEVTEEGRRSYGAFAGRSARYRLTFYHSDACGRTDEWRNIATASAAKQRVAEAVAAAKNGSRARWEGVSPGNKQLAQMRNKEMNKRAANDTQRVFPSPYVGSVPTPHVGTVITLVPRPHVGTTAPVPTQGVLSILSVRGAANIFLRDVRGYP